ncbi:MAG: hypothetical protein NUV65_05350 [Candidatus Roizmanbacteria bacterium]|nr:hypothetical protein [Candidatus Roizmanbacteria bacterium]
MKKKYREFVFTVMCMLFVLAIKLTAIPTVEGNFRISADAIHSRVIERVAIERVLKRYNSPLIPYTGAFINSCRRYNLDCYLLPAITGVESGFGHALIQNAKNPFGWGGGSIYFSSWENGIDTVAKGLHENYMLKGLDNPYRIAPVYAPPSTTWGTNVSMYMKTFEQEEALIAQQFSLLKKAGIM